MKVMNKSLVQFCLMAKVRGAKSIRGTELS